MTARHSGELKSTRGIRPSLLGTRGASDPASRELRFSDEGGRDIRSQRFIAHNLSSSDPPVSTNCYRVAKSPQYALLLMMRPNTQQITLAPTTTGK